MSNGGHRETSISGFHRDPSSWGAPFISTCGEVLFIQFRLSRISMIWALLWPNHFECVPILCFSVLLTGILSSSWPISLFGYVQLLRYRATDAKYSVLSESFKIITNRFSVWFYGEDTGPPTLPLFFSRPSFCCVEYLKSLLSHPVCRCTRFRYSVCRSCLSDFVVILWLRYSLVVGL